MAEPLQGREQLAQGAVALMHPGVVHVRVPGAFIGADDLLGLGQAVGARREGALEDETAGDEGGGGHEGFRASGELEHLLLTGTMRRVRVGQMQVEEEPLVAVGLQPLHRLGQDALALDHLRRAVEMLEALGVVVRLGHQGVGHEGRGGEARVL